MFTALYIFTICLCLNNYYPDYFNGVNFDFLTLILCVIFTFPLSYFIVVNGIVMRSMFMPEKYQQEASDQEITFCNSIMSNPKMSVWIKYIADFKKMNRPLYGYEIEEIEKYYYEKS